MFLIDGIQSLVKFVKKINFFRSRYFYPYFKYFWAFRILKIMFEPRYKTDEEGKLLINFSWIEFEKKGLSHVSHRWYSESGEIREEEKFL